jgi:glycosyltransferase involved in cell wall biosynthesis
MRVEERTPTRVLHVVRPAAGGMKAHVLQLAAGLGDHGFECHVACPGEADIVQPSLAAGIEVRPVPIVGPLRPLRDLEAVLVLMDIVRQGRYDIVHAHGAKAGLVGRVGAMLGGCRARIVTIHNDVIGGSIGTRMQGAYSGAERWLARHTARVIAVSDALRDQAVSVLGLSPALVVTVHNGLDISPYDSLPDPGPVRDRLGIPRDALVFGTVARFAPQKALDALVVAAVPVLERLENGRLASSSPATSPTCPGCFRRSTCSCRPHPRRAWASPSSKRWRRAFPSWRLRSAGSPRWSSTARRVCTCPRVTRTRSATP